MHARRCRPLDVEALQEWDHLHADEMTEAEHCTATAWAVGLDLYSAACEHTVHPRTGRLLIENATHTCCVGDVLVCAIMSAASAYRGRPSP